MTSVVVPVYNGAGVLPWSVPAVLALRGVAEVVWVDDGSTDDTAAGLARLTAGEPRARVIRLPANRGRGAARNAGTAATTGRTLVFVDADVRPPADLAERFLDALAAPGAVATVARLRMAGLDPTDPYHRYLRRHRRGVPDAAAGTPVPWKYFVTTACAVRRDALERAGGFDEDVAYGEDLALACELAAGAPQGLVASGATACMTDAGTLDEALAKVAEFGSGLPRLAERCPNVYRLAGLGRLVRPPLLLRAASWRPLSAVVRRLLPGVPPSVQVRAVRYLLGHALLNAHADARPADVRPLARSRR